MDDTTRLIHAMTVGNLGLALASHQMLKWIRALPVTNNRPAR